MITIWFVISVSVEITVTAYFLLHLKHCTKICYEELEITSKYCSEKIKAREITSSEEIEKIYSTIPSLRRMTPKYFYVWDKEKLRGLIK